MQTVPHIYVLAHGESGTTGTCACTNFYFEHTLGQRNTCMYTLAHTCMYAKRVCVYDALPVHDPVFWALVLAAFGRSARV